MTEDNVPIYLWDDKAELSEKEIYDANQKMLELQRHFSMAAEYVASSFSKMPEVVRIVLFGSVALPLVKEVPRFRKFQSAGIEIFHECRDVDLAVYLRTTGCLNALRKTRSEALNALFRETGIAVAHHQVDVFLFDSADGEYRGRLCIFGKCPKGKFVCKVKNCGIVPFLRQHEGFHFMYDSLRPENIRELYKG